VIGIHHLEGHLLSPLLASEPPSFPFVALLVSGGHTQLMEVADVGMYRTLGETLDDAAGEAFDKTAKLLGLGYPGGPAVSKLAETGVRGAIQLPRPMLHSNNLNFSFSGLKTAVSTDLRRAVRPLQTPEKADLARGFVEAVVEVLVSKSVQALAQTHLKRLVVAGGVGANRQLRAALAHAAHMHAFEVFYPDIEFCTDNGAMIALAGALRLQRWPEQASRTYAFTVRPRWDLSENLFTR
jgi:N6-L-threonylcarbamoyladenine synthase